MDMEECGKMVKIILILEEETVPVGDARGWEIEGQKRRVTRKENKRLREEFELGCFMAEKYYGILPRRG